MDFDKNTLTGIILIVLIFFGFTIYTNQQEAKYKREHPAKIDQTSKYPSADTIKQLAVETKPILPVLDSASTTAYGSFAAATKGSEQFFTIENEDCIYTFSNKGGVIKKVELKNYKTFTKKPLILFEDNGASFNFSFFSNDSKTAIQTEQLYFTTTATNQKITGTQKSEVVYKVDLGNGKIYEHHYTLNGKGFVVDFVINATNFSTVIPKNTSSITLDWTQQLPSQEGGIDDQRFNASLHYQNDAKEEDDLSRDKEKEAEKPLQWVSYKQKFFNTSLIATKDYFNRNAKIKVVTPTDKSIVKIFATKLEIPFNGNNAFSFPMRFYMGPNKYNEIKKLDVQLTKIIPLGWSLLALINKFFIIPIFHFLSKFISNYGVIIFILALIIKLVTFPFTYKSTLSMIKMKVLKPEIDELKKKYPDQATFGQKQMELYSQTGVSPFGGCLPMLLQMPILIAMYRFFPSSIELRQQPFLWATDLSSYDSIFHWTKELPLIGNHISLFTILMAISSILVTKLTQQSQPSAGGNDMMAQQMKMMQYVMPVMLLFMFNKQPAALSYYYFLFNVLTLAQNWIIQKFFVDEAKIHLEIQENKKKPQKKSAFQEKMQEMMKQQQELKKGK